MPLGQEQVMNLVRRDDVAHGLERLHEVDDLVRQRDR